MKHGPVPPRPGLGHEQVAARAEREVARAVEARGDDADQRAAAVLVSRRPPAAAGATPSATSIVERQNPERTHG